MILSTAELSDHELQRITVTENGKTDEKVCTRIAITQGSTSFGAAHPSNPERSCASHIAPTVFFNWSGGA